MSEAYMRIRNDLNDLEKIRDKSLVCGRLGVKTSSPGWWDETSVDENQ